MLTNPKRLGAPNVLDEATADEFLTAKEVTEMYDTCRKHQVTTCPSCNALWRMDQLRRETIGYYPGPPGVTRNASPCPDTGEPTRTWQTGNRYGFACPGCFTDLTHLVILHNHACTGDNSKPRSTIQH